MAETKKSATKEVAVEKKFCTKCGRELNAGEVCNCEATASTGADPMASFFSGFLDTFKRLIKKPYETLKREVAKSNVTQAIIMILMGAISFGLFLMTSIKSLYVTIMTFVSHVSQVVMVSDEYTKWGDLMEELIDSEQEFPLFAQFLFGFLAFIAIAAIVILIAVAIAKYKKNNNFDVKKGLSLFAVSSLPAAAAFLIMAVLGLFNSFFVFVIAIIIGVVAVLACFANFVSVYMTYINDNNPKDVYTLAALIVLIVLGVGIFTTVAWKPIGAEISNELIELNE